MQKNCFEFPLDTESIIKDYIIEKFKDLDTGSGFALNVDLPEDILEKVNAELSKYDLKIASGMAFKRRNDFYPDVNGCHIDYLSSKDQIIKSSLVIPIDGCENTCMYWVGGDFSTVVTIPPPESNYKNPYMNISWNAPGSVIEQVEISKGPMLCRVDVPHSATSKLDGSYRLVMTLRFEGNPSIEEIMSRRSTPDRKTSF
jgi:hypothetical protein